VDVVFTAAVDGRMDVNVALNRPAYQVSTYTDPFAYAANYANDGNNSTHLRYGPCAHTRSATNPWWSVDLLLPLIVIGIKFTNRDGGGTGTSDDPMRS